MTFRIGKTELTVRFGFFAVLAVVLCLDGGAHALPAVLACAVHEGGHMLAARLCGMRIEAVRFGALGIQMVGDARPLSHLPRAAVSLAGPLANLLFFALLLPMPRAYSAVQLLLFLFHILPAVPLDGGMALYSLLCSAAEERWAGRICTAVSVLLAFLLGTLGFSVLLRTRYNFTLLLLALYILLYLVLKRRESLC